MKYIVEAKARPAIKECGAKGASLAKLGAAGFDIPDWFAVKPAAFFDSMTSEQLIQFDAANLDAIPDLLQSLSMAEEIRYELSTALRQLKENDCTNTAFAVRSSALDEDGARQSFAGQLESYLFVRADEVAERVVDVWKSAFSERVRAYRREHNLEALPAVPAVLVQTMVAADTSGVAMSTDPVSPESRRVVIGALYGLGHGLVSGELDADTYFVSSTGIERDVARKNFAFREARKGGITKIEVDELSARKSALTDDQIQAVKNLARAAESHYGQPQDIEWAFAGKRLFLLQSRPITALGLKSETDGELRIFDNSNIGESYNGVTTPLTFTFARKAYKNVYLQFCRILMVPEKTLAANDKIFSSMIGLIDGRIYYNLINWYRVLAMLPGYAFNSKFMEQMMGVKEALPAEIRVAQVAGTPVQRLADALHLGGSLFGLVVSFIALKTGIKKFYARLADALAPVDLKAMSLDGLFDYYRSLETKLLLKWDAPLVNDFLAMIFYGVLGALTRKLLDDTTSTLQNDLLAQTGDIVSAEPAVRMSQMARAAATDRTLVDVLCNQSLPAIHRRLHHEPQLKTMYDEYLEKFGDRCIGELKLESATLYDDPLPLLRSVGQMAKRVNAGVRVNRRHGRLLRRRAEKQVYTRLANNPLQRALFAWVLSNARDTIRNRENLRFERTRVFGRVRQIFLEVGRRLAAQKLLNDSRDIFYLELEEILGFADGTVTTRSLTQLVAMRKAEFHTYAGETDPPNRIELRGSVGINATGGLTAMSVLSQTARMSGTQTNNFALTSASDESLSGIGCCPGIVRGPVRVVLDPKDAELLAGEILVAKRTDPGWITLFPAAAGLLVEHGSLLSHSAIVSRELGLPAVVSVNNLCATLQTGDVVEFNGSTGSIIVLSKVSAPPLLVAEG